jgi:hypothetical protein
MVTKYQAPLKNCRISTRGGGDMSFVGRICLVITIALGISACTLQHYIEEDYPEYLVKNAGTSNLPKTDKASEYALSPETQQHHYEFRSALTGAANTWIIEFGRILDDTMMSSDVQKAFGNIRKISDASDASGNVLIFDLQHYTFKDYSAHVSLKISLSRSNQVVFSKIYARDGKTQGGKMFWGGAFAQKNAVQQSTKDAIDAILRDLISDLNALRISRIYLKN